MGRIKRKTGGPGNHFRIRARSKFDRIPLYSHAFGPAYWPEGIYVIGRIYVIFSLGCFCPRNSQCRGRDHIQARQSCDILL